MLCQASASAARISALESELKGVNGLMEKQNLLMKAVEANLAKERDRVQALEVG